MAPKVTETDEVQRILVAGRSDETKCDNMITTSRYTMLTFFPVAIQEQFRRVANMYFLIIGVIMIIGYYTPAFDSAISPWTTLGPLAFVIGVSLLQEGSADYQRHKSDMMTNVHPCVVLRNARELEGDEGRKRDETVRKGRDVTVNLRKAYFLSSATQGGETPIAASASKGETTKIAYERVRRMDIRAGDIVLLRNREMVPADVVLLASSNDKGSAYIETSSIDGETNLKLRTSPHLPKAVVDIIKREKGFEDFDDSEEAHQFESLEQATKRVARMSVLAFPEGESVLDNPANPAKSELVQEEKAYLRPVSLMRRASEGAITGLKNVGTGLGDAVTAKMQHAEPPVSGHRMDEEEVVDVDTHYVAALSSEAPNASVNTYSGKLTMPPVELGGPGIDIPLNAENMLLRGAVLRNTEWAIGLTVFTGTDTKLVQNSFETPSKFSQLDQLMNKTVFIIIGVMILCIISLASCSVSFTDNAFDNLWYLGFNKDTSEKWPYLPESFEAPEWRANADNWIQKAFLFVTLLTNFVPLSLYVTIEIIVVVLKMFINYDLDMYHEGTDTRALARSSNVTDLGQVEYVFSDKTGTLTQNVMRFKRCSVDGLAFGAPVEKARPGADKDNEEDVNSSFHPLRQLLVGQVSFSNTRRPSDGLKSRKPSTGLAALGEEDLDVGDEKLDSNGNLTFNAEMFLRVMSLCHTVVVEKDLDNMEILQPSASSVEESSSGNRSRLDSLTRGLFGGRKNTGTSATSSGGNLEAIAEMQEGKSDAGGERQRADSSASKTAQTNGNSPGVGPDGAPLGFAYQAESPDEGALVQAASLTFGFQVVGRDASGIRLACSSPSLFQDAEITKGLKKGTLTSQQLASETAARRTPSAASDMDGGPPVGSDEPRLETWTVLAVNKFDSDRKRMSILLRSPSELGSIPMLLCKGADSSMLDPKVCVGLDSLMSGEEDVDEILMRNMELDVPRKHDSMVSQLTTATEFEKNAARATDEEPTEDFETTALLGIQAHLGDFASEGLRTLVLGVRILADEECDQWMETYTAASTAIKGREEKLRKAASEIEQNIHIVGATAIEDKLQRGVPETIAKLEKAGIKLWVLTGDKRETAIEIGYATHVLTSKMHVTEVADGSSDHVRALMAMEFMRLVKMGKLTDYQRSVVGSEELNAGSCLEDFLFRFGKWRRAAFRAIRRFYHTYIKTIFCILCYVRYGDDAKNPALVQIEFEVMREERILKARERKKNVRNRAEQIIKEYNAMTRKAPKKGDDDELSLTNDKRPQVFTRSMAAKTAIKHRRSKGSMTSTELRSLELAEMIAQDATEGPLIEEDLLSLQSFLPSDSSEGKFDGRKRTLLERVFAVDSSVRHGTLVKHLREEKLKAIREDEELGQKFGERGLDESEDKALSLDTPRGLVIEGAALAHLLGDSELEELLFAVASCSDSVIACRVSPKQKALLVGLVRNYVVPEPVTLAIGDGANDVGMIQEAHVGVGISGLEGQQAVNASDFAIAQFRYLEELLLVHGRWNFFRQTTVVLFSFYKNAVMAGNLIVFQGECLYSGQPLFDDWLIAMLNFVAGCPILFLGFFDRCLEKDYVKNHPEVYGPARRNELLTLRILFRWIILAFVHIFTLFFFTVWPLNDAGGITSAYTGMMRRKQDDAVGDGQGGDLKSVGTVTFTCLVVLLGFKVFYESKTILVGKFPVFTCRKGVGEGWLNRMRYSFVGTLWLSYAFYSLAAYLYGWVGTFGPSQFSQFVAVPWHVLHTRSVHWLLIVFVPVFAMAFDVTLKVFSNLYYPTQTQIHLERQAKLLKGKLWDEDDLGTEGGHLSTPRHQRAASMDHSFSA